MRLASLLATLLPGCFPVGPLLPAGPAPATVDGPETPSLLHRAHVCVAVTSGGEMLELIDSGDGTTTPLPAGGRVWEVTGPDRSGRVLWVEEHRDHCRLVAWSPSGSVAHELERARGDWPFWQQTIYPALALAPSGERLALLRGTDFDRALLEVRRVEGWELERSLEVDQGARPRWLPGEVRIALNRRARAAEIDAHCAASDARGWAMAVLDPRTGEERTLHAGLCELVLPDGTLVARTDGGALHRVDPSTGACTLVEQPLAPGLLRGLGAVEPGLIVYFGRVTTGEEQRTLSSPMKAPQWRWTLKVSDPATGEFATLLPHVARFHRVSFGVVDR